MFKRLLHWLTKRPEKESSRELLKEYKSEIKGNKKQKRSKKNMPNEEVKTEEKVVEQTEEKKVPTTETKDEAPVEKAEEKSTEDKVEQKPEVPAMEEEAQPTEEEVEKPQVQEEQGGGNGIRIEDLVTKEELASRLSALEAKYDAVIKENQDLKEKYENKDFGNFQKQGMVEKDKQANSTFDEYSKQFM